MKIKRGFVTNSSSSSYLVIIPSKFNLDDHKEFVMERIGDEWGDEEENDTLHYDEVKLAVDELKNRGTLTQYEFYSEFYVLQSLFEEQGFTVFEISQTGGDGEGSMYNLGSHPDVIKKIKELS